ncbi:hypothetical protein ACFYVR_24680 [Rhodococcus sp. NPDC003318]|uniref:hypothetical protein n=1 Tax=Rhodococcus sp. NPDC003318 TaxID=3364503 RepID=UPI0036C7BA8B
MSRTTLSRTLFGRRSGRLPAALLLTAATLAGGSGLAHAQPPLPPAVAGRLDTLAELRG